MIGIILLPAPAPLLSHVLILCNHHQRLGPQCSLSKQGHRFLSTLTATDSDDLSATRRLLRKFVASNSKHVALSTLSHLLSPTTSHHRLCFLALPVRRPLLSCIQVCPLHCEVEWLSCSCIIMCFNISYQLITLKYDSMRSKLFVSSCNCLITEDIDSKMWSTHIRIERQQVGVY